MGGRGGRAFKTTDASKSSAFFGVNQTNGMFPDWRNNLLPDQLSAVRFYTGSAYEDINDALRISGLHNASSRMQETIANITDAIDKFKLKKSLTVYRGASGAIFGGDKTVDEINAMARAGARLTDKGFMSTSASEGAQFGGDYRFVITVPAGTGRGAYVAPVSHYGSENEFLLQRNSTFKIVKAVQSGYHIDVHLRLEPKKKKKN